MKKDTWFLIISFSVLSAVVGGYVGTILSHIPEENSISTMHNLDGRIGFVKNTIHAPSVEHTNSVRVQAKQDLHSASVSKAFVNETLNNPKPQASKQLNATNENTAEIQSAEVDGVRYSLTKSDKGHIVQITTKIPDVDITEVMDVFTKMVDIEKLKKFYATNDKKTLEQAVGAYNFIENANMRAAQWCEPYYSLKVLPSKMRAKFASRQQYAATLLKNAWGDNWKSIIKTMQKRLEPKMMQAAEYNYQATKSLAAEYNERLSREEYCKMLDEDSDYEVKHKDKLFKQLYPEIEAKVDTAQDSQYVVYNHVSKIYHKPNCDWVQKCGNNCLKTQKGAAIIDGGRHCHVCNP